jgi:DNA repair protein SbcD/Mre11
MFVAAGFVGPLCDVAVVRLLLCSDLHLDAPFTWAGPTVARARRQAIREALSAITELAAELDVDALCCAGDLYESERSGADTGEFLRSAFAALPCPVLLAPGNHDWYGPASLYRHVDWSPNVTVFTGDRLAPHSLSDGFTVWGAAHCAPANTDGFLDAFRVDRSGVSVGLFHGSERGAFTAQGSGKVPHAPFVADQIPAAGLAHAMVGHFHRSDLGAWHTYPGNPEPLSFGEQGHRGAVLLTFAADGTVSRDLYPVSRRRWHDVRVEVAGVRHAGEIREQVRAALDEVAGIVRLTVAGRVEPGVDLSAVELGGLGPHLEALVIRPLEIRIGYDLETLSGEPTVRGHFIRDVLAADLPAEQQRRVITAGLLALDGRADELAAC